MFKNKKLFAGIEAGGTKFICAIGDGEGEIYDRINIPTTSPDETMENCISFFNDITMKGKIAAFGIGTFGPIDNHHGSPKYGYITTTPKTKWIDYNIVGSVKTAFDVPIGFETDVETAARGEYEWGAGKGLQHIIYITVGTGIGAASIINGQVLPGLGHQEMGHILVPQDKKIDSFSGTCHYHPNCLESLACGVAIKERWQVQSALDLPADHPAWELEAEYLASGLMSYILCLSPDRIIMGGGVMKQSHLFPMIRQKILEKLQGFVNNPLLESDLSDYIVPPGLSERSGVAGAIALAKKAFHEK